MPNYVLSNVIKRYEHSASPPQLDKVVFTIDHIHQGGAGLFSTRDVVKFLTSQQIPVTVFIQCSDPRNRCPADRRNARKIFELNPNLVTLGTHSLSRGTSQSEQLNNHNLLREVIRDITGSNPVTHSYHGRNAGPEPGISYAGIRYARGIKSSWSAAQRGNPLDTPVMGLNSVNHAFEYTRLRNLAGLSATLFVHSNELRNGSVKKRVFDTFIKAVRERRLQALSYLSAMQSDYSATPTPPSPNPNPTPTPNPPTPTPIPPDSSCRPLRHFTNKTITQTLRKNSRDGRRGIFQVAELQRFLNEIGLDAGIVDGIFGNNTKLAVIGYQISKGLSADGIVGRNTRASINTFCN